MKEKHRIQNQKNGFATETDRILLANQLLKFGYAVKHGKERPAGKTTGAYTHFVEYWEDE